MKIVLLALGILIPALFAEPPSLEIIDHSGICPGSLSMTVEGAKLDATSVQLLDDRDKLIEVLKTGQYQQSGTKVTLNLVRQVGEPCSFKVRVYKDKAFGTSELQNYPAVKTIETDPDARPTASPDTIECGVVEMIVVTNAKSITPPQGWALLPTSESGRFLLFGKADCKDSGYQLELLRGSSSLPVQVKDRHDESHLGALLQIQTIPSLLALTGLIVLAGAGWATMRELQGRLAISDERLARVEVALQALKHPLPGFGQRQMDVDKPKSSFALPIVTPPVQQSEMQRGGTKQWLESQEPKPQTRPPSRKRSIEGITEDYNATLRLSSKRDFIELYSAQPFSISNRPEVAKGAEPPRFNWMDTNGELLSVDDPTTTGNRLIFPNSEFQDWSQSRSSLWSSFYDIRSDGEGYKVHSAAVLVAQSPFHVEKGQLILGS